MDARLGADCTEVARSEWLWEDTGIDETEGIPLGRCFGLEIPEDPALTVGFEGLHLGFDEAARVLLQVLAPCLDEVDVSTATNIGAAWVCSVVASADGVAWQIIS